MLHGRAIVKNARLQLGNGAQVFALDALPEAAANRRVRVRAKIKPVVTKNAFQEQLDFEPLQVGVVHLGERFGTLPSRHRYNHTRMRLRSWSVSTGFVI